jgi:uncharacterized protein (DUF362 family)
MNRITRRTFLQKAALSAAALPVGVGLKIPALRAVDALPDVSVAQGTNDDTPEGMLKTALEGLGGLSRFVKPGQVVVIKPNATWAFRPHTSSATDPDVLRALIQMVRALGPKRVLVVDHCSIDPGTAEALRINEIGKLLDELNVERVIPDRFNAPADTYVKIDIPNGKDFRKIGAIKAAVEADVRINLAVAKSHNVTKMSMCLKHMMGLMEVPQNLHTSVEQGIADINQPSPMQAHLHILEAIRVRWPYPNGVRVCAGPETDLTYPNVIKRMNTIVAGIDPVLVDSYGCIHFFNYKPEELTHVLRAFESGVGQMDVDLAQQEGRLRVFKAGQPIPTQAPTSLPATPTMSATKATTQAAPVQAVTANTPTPLPTATPLSEGPIAMISNPGPSAAAGAECAADTNTVVSPNHFLNGALIPAAIVILGAGMAVARHLGQEEKGAGDGADPV